jgi:hypothetical protein
MSWHWDPERGRRVRTRSAIALWADRRDPLFVGMLVGLLVAAGLGLAGAPLVVICVGGLVMAASSGAFIELASEGAGAADLAAPNPAELTPADAARMSGDDG